MRKFRHCVLLASLLLPLSPAAMADATIDPATRTAIQGVISRQLAALSKEDGTAAESYASQGIRDKFPDGPAFMAMVHKNYGALIRPKSTVFGTIEESPHGPLQSVTIVASDGTVWTAVYSLEKVDGTWHITGCGLQRDEGQMDI